MRRKTKLPANGNSRTYPIVLHPEDNDYIEAIKQAHGLMRVSDAIRLALRETVKQIETSKQPTA